MTEERKKLIEQLKHDVQNSGYQYSAPPIGLLSAETTLALIDSIDTLQKQIPITISELRTTLREANERSINSQEALAKSNDRHSKAMVFLTQILAVAALVQALSSYAQWQVSEASVEIQRSANAISEAQRIYEISRDERIEMRDVDWRRFDIEHER